MDEAGGIVYAEFGIAAEDCLGAGASWRIGPLVPGRVCVVAYSSPSFVAGMNGWWQ